MTPSIALRLLVAIFSPKWTASAAKLAEMMQKGRKSLGYDRLTTKDDKLIVFIGFSLIWVLCIIRAKVAKQIAKRPDSSDK